MTYGEHRNQRFSSLPRTVLTAALVLAGASVSLRAHAKEGEATQFLKTKQDAVMKVLKQPARTPADEQKREKQLDALLSGFLDYGELSQRSLGEHWKTKTEAQRKEFTSLLTQLIQRNYQRNLKRTLEFHIKYTGENVEPDRTVVSTVARSTKEGRAEPVTIDYALAKSGAAYRVTDIVTDGVSLVRNYRNQFNRILKKDGWDELIKRMKKRVESGGDDL